MVTRYVPAGDVEIDGVRRTLLYARVAHDADALVSTATIGLHVDEGTPTPGQRVRIRAGFAPVGDIIFTGEIDTDATTLAPNDLEVTCSGYLARTRDPIGAPPDIVATLSGDTSDQEPVITYEGQTASAIIGDLCDRYGIPSYSLDDSGALWGELEPIGLTIADAGETLIKALDEDEFYRTFDGPDGTVRRVPWLRVPGASVARSWLEGVDLFAARLEASRVGLKNRIIATGLPQKGTTGVAFVPTGIAEAESAYIPTPPEFKAETHNSALLETGDRCQSWAETRLGERNRLRSELPVELVAGDPALHVGMTVSVTSARLGLASGDRFLVRRVEHSYDDAGFNTAAILEFVARGSGYNPNQRPIALIDVKGHLEYLADGTAQYEFALDGSASYDPELGVAGVVSYAWSGTPATPTPHGSGMTASVKFSGTLPAGATVTLTVTDNLGLTGTATVPLTASAAPIVVRDIIAALGTTLEVSRDGQRTWIEVTKPGGGSIAAVGTCEFGASTFTFAWDSDGQLYKVLADNTAIDVTPSGGSVAACYIGADLQGAANGRVWCGGASGRVWYSGDEGLTWEEVASAPNGATVTHISESPYQDGDLTLCAGNAYYRTFDAGSSWTLGYAHPNTNLVARRFASGFAQGWIGFNGDASGSDAGASRIRERDNLVALDIPGGYPKLAIVGLCFDVFEQRLYIADNEASDAYHGRLWTAATATSGSLVPKTYDYVLYGPLRHIIRDGGMPGLVYLASQNNLLKSIDGFESIQNMRNLTGGREGMMIGYGGESLILRGVTIVSAGGAERMLGLWNGAGLDDPPANWYAPEYDDSAWSASATILPAGSAPDGELSAAALVWYTTTVTAGDGALLRRSFDLAEGAISEATLRVQVDNYIEAIYINGHALTTTEGGNLAVQEYDVAAYLLPGRTNTIAICGREAAGVLTWIAFKLAVNGG